VIFDFLSNTAEFHMHDWKFLEGGREVKLGCKMGRCMKKVGNYCPKGYAYPI